MNRDQLLDLLTTAATIGRNDDTIGRCQTRGDITEVVERRMRDKIQQTLTPTPRVQVLHVREPDDDCSVNVYVDGVRLNPPYVEDIDPGRGYTQEDYEEDLESLRVAALAPNASDFDTAAFGAYERMRRHFEKWSTDHRWEPRDPISPAKIVDNSQPPEDAPGGLVALPVRPRVRVTHVLKPPRST